MEDIDHFGRRVITSNVTSCAELQIDQAEHALQDFAADTKASWRERTRRNSWWIQTTRSNRRDAFVLGLDDFLQNTSSSSICLPFLSLCIFSWLLKNRVM